MLDHKDGVSQTLEARKFKCWQVYISKTLKTKSLIMPRKKVPLRTCDQIGSARTKCDRLYRISANKLLILEDKSYFIFNHTLINEMIFIIQVMFLKHRQVSNSSPVQNLKRNYSFCFSDKGIF